MRTGSADLPLHPGRAPRWLFSRMTALARAMSVFLVEEESPAGLLRRLSDPFWFQAFGCVLGFDWHSSGLTTTVCGALKEGLKGREKELGVFICGGKGARSRRAPAEIDAHCARFAVAGGESLVYASRMSAKVDSAGVQDGHQIYHHCFLFTAGGAWAVIQQGMNVVAGTARRYHWLSPDGTANFCCDPHHAVCKEPGERQLVLNLVASEAGANRAASVQAATELRPTRFLHELDQAARLELPRRHWIQPTDLSPSRLHRVLLRTYERAPPSYEALLSLPGVGARTLRALALVGELLYEAPVSLRDPARFSFAHGGKDGTPYPVDRATYDRTIAFLGRTVEKSRLAHSEKRAALQRLIAFAHQSPD